ncbi:MAG: hypothetical protein ABIS27_09265 [Longimicrobiales bacterium]
MQFIAVLRERRLVQIILSYIAGSWALLGVFDQLADRAIVGEIVYQIVLIFCVMGLPAAVLIAWHHGEKGKQQAPLSEMILLGLLAVIAVGFSGVKVAKAFAEKTIAEARENPLELKRVAVLYFQNESADSANQYIADGLTEGLIEELSTVQALHVISRNGSAQFRDRSIDVDSIPAIAAELDVGTIVTGSIRQQGDKIRVALELLHGQSGELMKRKTMDYPASDLIGMKDAIVKETAELLRTLIGGEVRTRETATGTTKVGAWSLLQRAERARKEAEQSHAMQDDVAAAVSFARADSLLAEAEKVDPEWTQPIVDRAAISYRQARLAQAKPGVAVSLITAGIAHAERALRRSAREPRALELRGTLKYYKWLLQVETDSRAQQQLYDDAKQDLTNAVEFNPALPTAHATLSHMYSDNDVPHAIAEAQMAYEQDAYLEVAPLVLWRLFNGNYEQKLFTKAGTWCREGHRRFATDYRFVNCQLRMLNTDVIEPDSISIPHAWALLAQQDSLTPLPRKPFEHARGEMIVAGAIAIKDATLRDSARAVLNRVSSDVTRTIDPGGELVVVEAYIRVLTGEQDRAIDLLSRAAASDPVAFEQNRKDIPWYWDGLRAQPRFRKLFRLN